MCGIAGITRASGLAEEDFALLDPMLRVLSHRGPDDQFMLRRRQAALGARRLAILDLNTGRQPLANEDDSIIASNNGEIYNYLELRAELIRRGHVFRSDGDTEVIAHLYEERGLDFVHDLRGMFAIALWDEHRQRLVLARDRLGKKPVYWRSDGDQLWYGSELKSILQHPSAARVVDHDSLAQYLQYQYVPSPRTILAGVSKLPPASILVWEAGDTAVSRYWTCDYSPKSETSLDERAEALRSLLRESVRIRLRSDVPVGLFLSGGMDSSAVAAFMADLQPTRVKTFSIGFDQADHDELNHARTVATAFGTDHFEAVVSLHEADLLPEIAEHFDEPFADSSAIPTFRVAQLASEHVKVVLTGDGGDEVFGGYRRYVAMSQIARISRLPGPLLTVGRSASLSVLGRVRPGSSIESKVRRAWDVVRTEDHMRYLGLMSIFSSSDVCQLMRPPGFAPTDTYLVSLLNGHLGRADSLMAADLVSYLPEDLLVKMDRATMANSVEARSPLLDHNVVEFGARTPEDQKIRGAKTKLVLRRAVEGLLPPHHLDRPKMGFAVPIDSWFAGRLGDMLVDLWSSADSPSRDLIDLDVATRFLDEHRARRRRNGHRLWSLLMLELWARRWLTSAATS